jgi:hypothetical protein
VTSADPLVLGSWNARGAPSPIKLTEGFLQAGFEVRVISDIIGQGTQDRASAIAERFHGGTVASFLLDPERHQDDLDL